MPDLNALANDLENARGAFQPDCETIARAAAQLRLLAPIVEAAKRLRSEWDWDHQGCDDVSAVVKELFSALAAWEGGKNA